MVDIGGKHIFSRQMLTSVGRPLLSMCVWCGGLAREMLVMVGGGGGGQGRASRRGPNRPDPWQ